MLKTRFKSMRINLCGKLEDIIGAAEKKLNFSRDQD